MDGQEKIEKILDICKKICNSRISQLKWDVENCLVPTNLIVELRLLIKNEKFSDEKSRKNSSNIGKITKNLGD